MTDFSSGEGTSTSAEEMWKTAYWVSCQVQPGFSCEVDKTKPDFPLKITQQKDLILMCN